MEPSINIAGGGGRLYRGHCARSWFHLVIILKTTQLSPSKNDFCKLSKSFFMWVKQSPTPRYLQKSTFFHAASTTTSENGIFACLWSPMLTSVKIILAKKFQKPNLAKTLASIPIPLELAATVTVAAHPRAHCSSRGQWRRRRIYCPRAPPSPLLGLRATLPDPLPKPTKQEWQGGRVGRGKWEGGGGWGASRRGEGMGKGGSWCVGEKRCE